MVMLIAVAALMFFAGALVPVVVAYFTEDKPKPPRMLSGGAPVSWHVERRAPTYRDPGWVTITVQDEKGEPALARGSLKCSIESAEFLANVLLGNVTGKHH